MIRKYLAHLFHLIFPSLCISCGLVEPLEGSPFCLRCIKELPYVLTQKDARASLIGKDSFPSEVHYFNALFYYTKEGMVADLIHDIKYSGQYRVAQILGKLLGEKIVDDRDWSGHVIVPLPLHKKRLKSRGYNQSNKIAQGLSEALNIPIVNDLVSRVQETTTQTGKSKIQRRVQLEGAFSLTATESDVDKVLVVDDVITTGATIHACVSPMRSLDLKDLSVVSLGVSV